MSMFGDMGSSELVLTTNMSLEALEAIDSTVTGVLVRALSNVVNADNPSFDLRRTFSKFVMMGFLSILTMCLSVS